MSCKCCLIRHCNGGHTPREKGINWTICKNPSKFGKEGICGEYFYAPDEKDGKCSKCGTIGILKRKDNV